MQRARGHQHPDQRQPERQFVADHLCGRPQPAQEGILVVGRPTAKHHAVDPQRRQCKEIEDANIHVRDLQPDLAAPQGNGITERNDGETHQRGYENGGRRGKVNEAVHVPGDHVFLEEKLETVGNRLEQSPRPHPVRTQAVLDNTR